MNRRTRGSGNSEGTEEMKSYLFVMVLFVLCGIFVLMPSANDAVAGVADKVAKAQLKRDIKAVRSLGEANDCERDCDGSKATATVELARLADTCNGPVAAAARKELRKDLRRSESSVTRQRVQAAGAR